MTRLVCRRFLVASIVIVPACRSGDVPPQLPRDVASAAAQAPTSFTTSWGGNRRVSSFSVSPPGAPAARQFGKLRHLEPDGALVVETRQAGGDMRRVVYDRARQ